VVAADVLFHPLLQEALEALAHDIRLHGLRLPIVRYQGQAQVTSAKIRALAQAGYDRQEIASLLGIRYQHVRQVLIAAGISGGLRRHANADREPLTIEAAPAPREATSWEILLRGGFQCVGEWTQNPESRLAVAATVPEEPGVYAFVVDETVAYVGLTTNGLQTRLDQYRRGHAGQRTNARVNKLIGETLSSGKQGAGRLRRVRFQTLVHRRGWASTT
jgi:hypothetical protein